ncbi:MAG: hypothetical protein HY909_14985 [Deltaproteobacteria bacterium]|nr:hypothetical protein [Deltaproteobacteria bacterium]
MLPLVDGGRVEVDGLLAPGVLREWSQDPTPDATVLARIGKSMHDRLARLGAVGSADLVAPDTLGLCAAWYNLLALTHPEARGRKGLRRTARRWTLELLGWVERPYTRAEVSLRHGILGRLADLGRVDTHVEFWAGYADYIGVAPARSVVALPTLRRVREERTRVDFLTLLKALEPVGAEDTDTDLVSVARVALALSPLTDLSLAERPAPLAFAWSPPAVEAMADGALRGAALRVLLGRGTPAIRAVEQATLALAREPLTPPVARTLTLVHLELLALDALSARASGAQGPAQPLGLDAFHALGYARTAALLGLPEALLLRALPPDPNRPAPKDPPSAPLLTCARLMENRT